MRDPLFVCDRGVHPLAQLDLSVGKPQLILTDDFGVENVVAVTPSFALVLVILAKKWVDHPLARADRRGAMRAVDLAATYGRIVPPVQPETLTRYVWRIRERVREAVAALESEHGRPFAHPSVIETIGSGYRIGLRGLVVFDVVPDEPRAESALSNELTMDPRLQAEVPVDAMQSASSREITSVGPPVIADRPSLDSLLRTSRPVLLQDTSPGSSEPVAGDWIELPQGAWILRQGPEDVAIKPFRAPGPARSGVAFELAASGRTWSLLMFSGPQASVKLNGVPAAPVSRLQCGDVLRIGSNAPLHVSEHHSLVVEAPPPHLVGRPCALCSVAFVAESLVHVCACGCARHGESLNHFAGEEPLECMSVGPCPACARDVPAGGLSSWPSA